MSDEIREPDRSRTGMQITVGRRTDRVHLSTVNAVLEQRLFASGLPHVET